MKNKLQDYLVNNILEYFFPKKKGLNMSGIITNLKFKATNVKKIK